MAISGVGHMDSGAWEAAVRQFSTRVGCGRMDCGVDGGKTTESEKEKTAMGFQGGERPGRGSHRTVVRSVTRGPSCPPSSERREEA